MVNKKKVSWAILCTSFMVFLKSSCHTQCCSSWARYVDCFINLFLRGYFHPPPHNRDIPCWYAHVQWSATSKNIREGSEVLRKWSNNTLQSLSIEEQKNTTKLHSGNVCVTSVEHYLRGLPVLFHKKEIPRTTNTPKASLKISCFIVIFPPLKWWCTKPGKSDEHFSVQSVAHKCP